MFSVISSQTLVMFLMILVGLVIYKTHLTDHNGNKSISNILLLIVTPFMLLDVLLTIEYRPEYLRNFLIAIVLGFATHLLTIAVTHFMLGKNEENKDLGIERYLAVYSNCGFMGVPLVSAVFGAESVLYLTGYMIAFNVLTWTHGLIQVTGETSAKQLVKGLVSPTVICTLAGIVMFLLRIRLETHVLKAVSSIGSMNTPLGMIVAGCALGETNLAAALKKPRLYLVSALKLVVMPAVTFAFLFCVSRFVPISRELFFAILVPSACPPATTGTMMALRYGADYEYTSQVFVISTLVSMLTIPLFVSMAMSIAGL